MRTLRWLSPIPSNDLRAPVRSAMVLAGLLAAFTPLLATAAADPPSSRAAFLSVATEPTDAEVLLYGESIGRTPVEQHELEADLYVMTVLKAGYQPVDTLINLAEGERLQLRFRLVPLTDSPPAAQPPSVASTEDDPSAKRAPSESSLPETTFARFDEVVPAQETTTSHFDNLLAEGNEFYLREQYVLARLAYEQALDLRPGDARAQGRIIRVDSMLARMERQRETYSYHRGRGDALYEQAKYWAAVQSYRLALKQVPEDPYVETRLADAQNALSNQRAEAAPIDASTRWHPLALPEVAPVPPADEAMSHRAASPRTAASTVPPGSPVAEPAPQEADAPPEQTPPGQQETAADPEAPTGATTDDEPAETEPDLPADDLSLEPIESVYVEVEQRPRPVGGPEAIAERVRYPEAAVAGGREGTVVILFVVDRQGRVRSPFVVEGMGAPFDAEALRALRQTRFEPGMVNGTAVNTQHEIAVPFSLPSDE